MISELIPISKYATVITGEGVLQENKQKNFRTESFSLWNLEDFLRFASPDMIRRNRTRLGNLYSACVSELEEYKKNRIHEILARWEASGFIKGIITENIDGLHQLAGSKRVIEVYGTMRELYCTNCGMTYPIYRYYSEDPARCDCGGFVRPEVVLSYESVPKEKMDSIREEILKADLIINIGCSIKDNAIASVIKEAKEKGAKLVAINNKPPEIEPYSDEIVINEKLCEALAKIDEELKHIV